MNKIIFFILLVLIIVPSFSYAINQKIESANIEITVEEAKNLLTKKQYIFIDVREESEYKEGHIPEIKLISLSKIQSKLPEFDKQAKYITVCARGGRSLKAAKLMKDNGFDVLSMKGGMNAWKAMNYPVKSEP